MNAMIETGEITFSKDGTRLIKKTYLEDQGDLAPSTLWAEIEETGHNRQAKYELKKLFPDVNTADLFGTPKPEKLLQRICEIATNENDLVLDSFLGSGTTAAVAHKMGRRYIGIEIGDHAITHCVPRLQKVIEGEQGGISKAVNWQGGGGFRFYRLGQAIFDEDGQINPTIRFEHLAAHIWFSETRTPWLPYDGRMQSAPTPNNTFVGDDCIVPPTNPNNTMKNNKTIMIDDRRMQSSPPTHHDLTLGADCIRPQTGPNETHQPGTMQSSLTALLGVHNGVAYYLLYNGILGDKRPQGGNVLTTKILALLPAFNGPKIIYGETSRLGKTRLEAENITFKQTPYDIKAR
jgi:adenine-specific DNA-methyltransferase